jgi:hypothetical protein
VGTRCPPNLPVCSLPAECRIQTLRCFKNAIGDAMCVVSTNTYGPDRRSGRRYSQVPALLALLALGNHPEHITHGIDDKRRVIEREVEVGGAVDDALLATRRKTAQVGLLRQPGAAIAFIRVAAAGRQDDQREITKRAASRAHHRGVGIQIRDAGLLLDRAAIGRVVAQGLEAGA